MPTPDWTRRAQEIRDFLDTYGPAEPWRCSTIEATYYVGKGAVVSHERAEMEQAGVAIWGSRHEDPEWTDWDWPNLVHQRYHLWRWQKENPSINFAGLDSIVEFGAGYGAMAIVAHRLGFRGRYYTFDIDPMPELQQAHLEGRGILGPDGIIEFAMPTADPYSDARNPALLIACYSLDEVLPREREAFLQMVSPYNYLIALSKRQAWATDWAETRARRTRTVPQAYQEAFVEQPATKGHYLISHKG